MSSPSVINPLPAMDCLHRAHTKQWECQCRPSKEMNLVPPCPVIGLAQQAHRLANNSPKHSAQYGLSSRLANFCPARGLVHLAHTKHSLCQGSPLNVTPPVVRTNLHLVHFVAIRSSKQVTQQISLSLGMMKDLAPTQNTFLMKSMKYFQPDLTLVVQTLQ